MFAVHWVLGLEDREKPSVLLRNLASGGGGHAVARDLMKQGTRRQGGGCRLREKIWKSYTMVRLILLRKAGVVYIDIKSTKDKEPSFHNDKRLNCSRICDNPQRYELGTWFQMYEADLDNCKEKWICPRSSSAILLFLSQ